MIVRVEAGNRFRTYVLMTRRAVDGHNEYILTEHDEDSATATVAAWSQRPTPAQVLRKIAEIYELERPRDPPRRKKYFLRAEHDG